MRDMFNIIRETWRNFSNYFITITTPIFNNRGLDFEVYRNCILKKTTNFQISDQIFPQLILHMHKLIHDTQTILTSQSKL